MPLFRRPDGVLIKNLSPVRHMIPYIMKKRNESIVLYEHILDLTKTLPFIEEYNRTHPRKITVFHLIFAGTAKGLVARPGLNRFVSGGRIYQRKGAFISFAAKKKFDDEAPLSTIKLPVYEDEALDDTVERLYASVGEGRSDKERPVDTEVRLVTRLLPGWLLRLVLALVAWLDAVNLLPWFFMKNDPMYSSLFMANLGSVGIDRAFHHLYEYGTISLFGVVGTVKPMLIVGEGGQAAVKPGVRVCWSFDERINDGFYCAASLEIMRNYVENPELFATQPIPPKDRKIKVQPSAF